MVKIKKSILCFALLLAFLFPGHRLLLDIIESAAAQSGGLGAIITSPVSVGGFFPFNGGPQASVVPANGGTVTCTGGGTPTVTNSKVTANSVVMFGLKTAGGTPAVPIMTAVTAGTSFQITCGGSDTSVYNYVILG